MSYIQSPSVARSLVACAIASMSLAAIAQDAKQETPQEIAGPADPIVVTATRIPTRYNQLISDVSVVDQEQIREYSPAEPITDILANQPGITVRNSGGLGTTATVQIRGASAAQTVLLVDGLRLSSSTLGVAPWAYIPMPQIGRMEIVRGPTSSSYGSDAIGGVVQLFTRKGEGPAKFYADAGYGTYGTTSETVGVEGSVDGLSYSAYGSNTHSVSFPVKATGNDIPATTPASYTNTSFSGNLAYTVAPGQEFGIKALQGSGSNGYAGYTSYPTMSTMLSSLNVLSAYTKNRIIENWTSLIRVGSSQDNQRSINADNTYSVFNTTQKQLQWQHDLKMPVGNATLAYEYLNQLANTNSSATSWGEGSSNNYSRNINTFQGGWNADIGNNLLQANIRNDANTQFGNATTGSVGYGYYILPTIRATASWGTGFQAPTFNDLYSTYGGNPNLNPAKSQNTEAGIRYDDGTHRAGVIYYYNNINNYIQWLPTSPVPYSDWAVYNVGNANIQGVTTTYGGKVFALDVSASVDYQNAIANYNQSISPSAGMSSGIMAYHPHAFGSLTIEKNNERWKLGGQMQSQSSQQSNPGNVGGTPNQTLGGYSLFNLYGSVGLVKDISLFARLNNVFDKQYQTVQSYRTAGSNVFVGLRFDTR